MINLELIDTKLNLLYSEGNGDKLSLAVINDTKNINILNFNITTHREGILHTQHVMSGGVSSFEFKYSTLSEYFRVMQEAENRLKEKIYGSHGSSFRDSLRNTHRTIEERNLPRTIGMESHNVVRSLYYIESLIDEPTTLPHIFDDQCNITYTQGVTYNVLLYTIERWIRCINIVYGHRYLYDDKIYAPIVSIIKDYCPTTDVDGEYTRGPEEVFWSEIQRRGLIVGMCEAFDKMIKMDLESGAFRVAGKNESVRSIEQALIFVRLIDRICEPAYNNDSGRQLIHTITHAEVPFSWLKTYRKTLSRCGYDYERLTENRMLSVLYHIFC